MKREMNELQNQIIKQQNAFQKMKMKKNKSKK